VFDVQEISSTSNEFIRAEVSARVTGGVEDVSGSVVSMAFVAPGAEPAVGDFTAAAWEPGGPPYYCRRLSGALADGDHDIWVRVLLGTEDVRRKVGVLRVT
jgi:hypothetical protein